MKLAEMFDNLDELRIDNKHGWGAVPYNQNVDYRGLRVAVKPSVFIKLAHKLETPFSADDIATHIQADGAIGAPFLMIAIPQDWFEGDLTLPAEVYGHEGRNRMTAVLRVEGDSPVETHLFFGSGLRNRDLTPEIIKRLNQSVISQRGELVKGPWFTIGANINEARQHLDFDKLYGKAFKITDAEGDPSKPGFSIVTPLNGSAWNWNERPEFKDIVKRHLNDPKYLGDHKYLQIIDFISEMEKRVSLRETQMTDDEEARYSSALKRNPWLIGQIRNPSEAVQLFAVLQIPNVIQTIANPTKAVQMAAVTSKVLGGNHAISYIKDPDDDVKLAAVKTDGMNIEYIKDPSEEIMQAAVQQQGNAIRYIKDPSEEVKMLAVENNPYCIVMIDHPSLELQKAAVFRYAPAITSISEPDPTLLSDPEFKDVMIRYLLSQIKKGQARYIDDEITHLKKLGINWSELDVIEKGREAVLKPNAYHDDNLDEAWSNTYKKSINCSDPKGFSQKAHCAARRKRAAGGKTKSKPVRESFNPIRYAEQARNAIEIGWIDNVLDRMAYGVSVGKITPAEQITKLLEENKDKIVRHLLISIRRPEPQLDNVSKIVDMLRKMGIKWTELSAIEKSLAVGMHEGKVTLYTRPDYFGAEVDDAGFDQLSVINVPLNQLIGFEPDEKMQLPKSQANVKKILAGLKKGDAIPPILVRKHGTGYQVLDGHHRFWAYKVAKKGSIPARIVSDDDIEEIKENFSDGKGPGKPGDSRRHGIPKHATLAQLDRIGNGSGRKAQLARWQANMRRGRSKTNETIAPHGDSDNELKMMKAGTKPAVLLNPTEFDRLYRPIASRMGWEVVGYMIPGFDGEFHVVAQRGDRARAERIAKLVKDVNATGKKMTPEYHRELGTLLGYSQADIDHFISKTNHNKDHVAEDGGDPVSPKSKPVVYVDMDGVLADLFNHVGELHDVEHYNMMSDQQWEKFFKTTDAYTLFKDLPTFSTANQLLRMVIRLFGGYKILSSPLNFDKAGSIKGKKEWLAKNISVTSNGHVFDHDKWKYAVQPDGTPNILIDDWGVNIKKWNDAGGIAIKYQADEDGLDELRAMLIRAST